MKPAGKVGSSQDFILQGHSIDTNAGEEHLSSSDDDKQLWIVSKIERTM